jgi:hypothetical protein
VSKESRGRHRVQRPQTRYVLPHSNEEVLAELNEFQLSRALQQSVLRRFDPCGMQKSQEDKRIAKAPAWIIGTFDPPQCSSLPHLSFDPPSYLCDRTPKPLSASGSPLITICVPLCDDVAGIRNRWNSESAELNNSDYLASPLSNYLCYSVSLRQGTAELASK